MQSRTLLATALAVALVAAGAFGLLASSSEAQDPPSFAVHFRLFVAGNIVGAFREVEVSSSVDELKTLELGGRTGGAAEVKVTAPQRPPTATLTRGLTSNNEVWEWRARVETGGVAGARRNATIVMLDQTAQEIARWNLVNAWPVKVTGAGNNGGDPPTEVVTLVADSIRYVGP